MRLFTAIEPPTAIRRQLAAIGYGLPDTRWLAAEQIHLTLVFIGELEPSRLQPVAEALSQVSFCPFWIEAQGIGQFRSGAIWLGVEPNPALNQLQAQIRRQLRQLQIPIESRRFHPHLTLGRVKRRHPAELARFAELHQQLHCSFEVDQFSLLSSQLSHQGAVHRGEYQFLAERT